jgi:hypothetical protein
MIEEQTSEADGPPATAYWLLATGYRLSTAPTPAPLVPWSLGPSVSWSLPSRSLAPLLPRSLALPTTDHRSLTTGFPPVLTTNHYPLTTAFTPPPCLSTPPPPLKPPPPCFSVPRSLVPLVPCSLLLPHPPIVSGPHPCCTFSSSATAKEPWRGSESPLRSKHPTSSSPLPCRT